MSSGNTQRKKRNTDRRTSKVDRRDAPVNATVEISTSAERKQLLDTCSQIGALIIGQRFDRMAQGVEVLQKQASGLLLKQHLEVWLPRFEEHYAALEKVVGKNLEISQTNLVNDLKAKVKAAGFPNMKEFLTKVILPVVSYHGLLQPLLEFKVALTKWTELTPAARTRSALATPLRPASCRARSAARRWPGSAR